MTSLLRLTSKESMITRNKSTRKKQISVQTMKTFNQLVMRPNITIRKTLHTKDSNEHKACMKEDVIQHRKKANDNGSLKQVESQIKADSATKTFRKRPNNTGAKSKKRPKRLLIENEEFYPETRKRSVAPKKIVLLPKHDYRVVATLNKRKRRTPQRELEPPELPDCEGSEPELSMEDLVRLADEQGLDDEDLMEILTCPSPVWWEENSGDQEEINIRFHEETEDRDDTIPKYLENPPSPTNFDELHEINYSTVDKINANNNIINFDNKIGSVIKNDINFFNKFVQKRSKLEKVLGNIKSKHVKPETPRNKRENEQSNELSRSKTRKDSTSGHSDASMIEEELLQTLENIEIPVLEIISDEDEITTVEDIGNYTDLAVLTRLTPSDIKYKNAIQKTQSKRNKIDSNSKKNFNKMEREVGNDSNELSDNKIDLTIKPNEIIDETDLEAVPIELPPLTKKPLRNIRKKSTCESPKSVESVTSENTNSSVIELDSISDTNIKFLDEYVDEITENTNESKILALPKVKTGEFVTVYNILPTVKDSNDIEDQINVNFVNKSVDLESWEVNRGNGKINSFYKKSKNPYQNKLANKPKVDETEEIDDPQEVIQKIKHVYKYENNQKCKSKTNNTKTVPNTRIKYCHKCSSIFETDICQYCKKTRKKNNNQAPKRFYNFKDFPH